MDSEAYRIAKRMCEVPDGAKLYFELKHIEDYYVIYSGAEAEAKRIARVVEILAFFNSHGFTDDEIEDALHAR